MLSGGVRGRLGQPTAGRRRSRPSLAGFRQNVARGADRPRPWGQPCWSRHSNGSPSTAPPWSRWWSSSRSRSWPAGGGDRAPEADRRAADLTSSGSTACCASIRIDGPVATRPIAARGAGGQPGLVGLPPTMAERPRAWLAQSGDVRQVRERLGRALAPTGPAMAKALARTHRWERMLLAFLVAQTTFLLGSPCSSEMRSLSVSGRLCGLVPVRRMAARFKVVAQAYVEAVLAWHGWHNAAAP